MKSAKQMALFLLPIMLLFSLASCGIFHKHTWQYRVAKGATCAEKGLLESLCTECGDKEYSDIEMAAHHYVSGVCTICGGASSPEPQLKLITVPAGTSMTGIWSMNNIYQKACSIDFNGSYSSFLSSLSGTFLKQPSFTLGAFGVTVSCPLAGSASRIETPLLLPITRVAIENPDASLGTLLRADITGGELIFTYTDGTECSAGRFGSGSQDIAGFGFNEQGELIICYANDMIAFAGKIE